MKKKLLGGAIAYLATGLAIAIDVKRTDPVPLPAHQFVGIVVGWGPLMVAAWVDENVLG